MDDGVGGPLWMMRMKDCGCGWHRTFSPSPLPPSPLSPSPLPPSPLPPSPLPPSPLDAGPGDNSVRWQPNIIKSTARVSDWVRGRLELLFPLFFSPGGWNLDASSSFFYFDAGYDLILDFKAFGRYHSYNRALQRPGLSLNDVPRAHRMDSHIQNSTCCRDSLVRETSLRTLPLCCVRPTKWKRISFPPWILYMLLFPEHGNWRLFSPLIGMLAAIRFVLSAGGYFTVQVWLAWVNTDFCRVHGGIERVHWTSGEC